MKKKTIALVLACILCVGIGIGGTLAWLTDKTDSVTNTFTTSDIDITLTETTGSNYKMVPGCTIAKNPKVTVVAGSEKCYLFVKLEESDNFDDFLTYTVADGWTALTGEDGVYYRIVEASDTNQDFDVISGNAVTVSGEVTKSMMNAIDEGKATNPTLTVTAYASQFVKNSDATNNSFTAADAWTNAQPTTPTT